MSKENGDMKIRLVELFAGIGAFSAAFRNTSRKMNPIPLRIEVYST